MLLQRCQKGDVKTAYDFRIVCGQYGEGIYAMKSGDRAMQKYYTQNGENTYKFEIHDSRIFDLSRRKLDYWGVREFIYNHPFYKAFILKHKGINIPTSKQILITDPSVITNIH